MILYLLLPALCLGNVESQTANMTAEEWSNQTFTESSTNSTMTPVNVTSGLFKDERTLIEDELQKNQTSVIMEDDESFQDQRSVVSSRHCQEEKLVNFSHTFCGKVFHAEMMSIDTEKWCVMKEIIGPYNDLAVCLENLSDMIGCYYPNPSIQDFFLFIHSSYFQNCSREEEDAPQGLVIALTLIPVSLIPILVYLVVWKSSVQE